MDPTSNASQISEIWLNYLIECARLAESIAIPFTDIFGIATYVRCLKIKEKTIKGKLAEAGIKSLDIDGVTEACYHAADIGRVFGSV